MADRKKRGSQRKAGKWRMLAAGFLLSAAFCLPASGMVRARRGGANEPGIGFQRGISGFP